MRIAAPRCLAAFLAMAAGASTALSQVVINEFWQNPPGSGSNDELNEYVEIYGTPGMKLDGYALAVVCGGEDPDGDGIPGPLVAGDPGDELPEIDEAWSLDGLTIGANGFLVLYNTTSGGVSNIPALLPAQTTRARMKDVSIPSTDVGGKIKNDSSFTLVLLRKRPFHSLNGSGQSVYAAGYAWRKDINPDGDFNSRLDFGYETAIPGTISLPQTGIVSLDPYQMVDDVAYSNSGGKEYVRSNEQRISDTVGFQPDACSRLFFFGANPHRGSRLNSLGEMVDTNMADEEWVYGETLAPASTRKYDPTAGIGGPTDQNSPVRYNDAGQVDPQGYYLMDDINLTGFMVTPGTFNDVDSSGSGGSNVVQFRFVEGDINFSGKWDWIDSELAQSLLGASLDDTVTLVDDRNTIVTGDDVTYTGWKWQGREFQTVLTLMNMDPADGPGGTNASVVTASDVAAAFRCPADYDSNGFVNGDDFDSFALDFYFGLPASDWDANGFVNGDDFDGFSAAFVAGC